MTGSRTGLKSQVKTNSHPEFSKVEQERPSFDTSKTWKYTKIPDVNWKVGTGANSDEWKTHEKISIDPYQEGRTPADNYKTLISAVVPRPIGFVSTIGKDGKRNLAPFSYFALVNHDPPVFTLGFSGGKGSPKDTCKNILDTEELTINIISEWFVEAANFTSINSPLGIDEWKLSGLTPLASEKVQPPHVAESAFSIEAKLIHSHEWKSRADPTKATGTLCIVEGVNFHVRKDVINEDLNNLDIEKLKPVARLGGITYSRVLDGYEKTRPDFQKEVEEVDKVKGLLQ